MNRHEGEREEGRARAPTCQTKFELAAMKDLKAGGSYLTNLKVNDFSISLHPRLPPVTRTVTVSAAVRLCAL